LNQQRPVSRRTKDNTWLRLVFLAILVVNLAVAANLFISVLNSAVALMIIRVVIMATVLGFLLANSVRHPEITGSGWYSVLAGFLLLMLEPVSALVAYLPSAASLLGPPASRNLELIREVIFRLFGFFFLAYGFFLWIPSIIQARRKAEKTAELLEQLVSERTCSLDRTNRELERSKAGLEEAARLKNEFLASFSHELKTPLNSILGFCRLLDEQQHGSLNEKQTKSIRVIDENSKILLERITRILDYAKLEFERITPEFREIDLQALLSETGTLFEPSLRRKGLAFSSNSGIADVITDRKLLGQVLQAAVDNAIKFTENGAISICATASDNPQRWTLEVSDTGEGIAEKELPLIFEAFRQGDGSLSRRHGGTGLGLTIVRRLTELLQGRVEVKSTPGRGTTIRFSFPHNPEIIQVGISGPSPTAPGPDIKIKRRNQ
jgi:signal transduction histidine kinase